jgi:hypothetical protein
MSLRTQHGWLNYFRLGRAEREENVRRAFLERSQAAPMHRQTKSYRMDPKPYSILPLDGLEGKARECEAPAGVDGQSGSERSRIQSGTGWEWNMAKRMHLAEPEKEDGPPRGGSKPYFGNYDYSGPFGKKRIRKYV